MNHGGNILTLNAMRGLLAVVVVLFHYTNNYVLAIITSFAMSFFFMLSGFLLARKYDFVELDCRTYKCFLGRRLWRVYPLHIAVLLAFALKFGAEYVFMGKSSDQWGYFLPQALLVQSWMPFGQVYLKLNGVSWFLSTIVFCYACYPLVVRWLHRLSIPAQVVVLAVALGAMMLAAVPLTGTTKRWMVYICPLMRLVDFATGIVLFHVWRRYGSPLAQRWGVLRETMIEVALLIAIGVFFVLQYTDCLDRFNSEPFTLVLNAALIMLLTVKDGGDGLFARVLRWRVFGWLGRISFEMYMLQLIVLIVMINVAELAGIERAEPLSLAIYLAVLLCLSWLWHKGQAKVAERRRQ